MKPVLVIADVHVGNPGRYAGPTVCGVNMRGRMILAALASAAALAGRHGADIVIAGDLFDHDTPAPALVAATFDALNVEGVTKYAALGNHDLTSAAPGDNALASLARCPGWSVIETPTVVNGLALVCPYNQRHPREWLAATLAAHRARWAITHFGIEDERTNVWLRDKTGYAARACLDAVTSAGYLGLLAGDWHEHAVFESGVVYQIGALCPTGYDNPGWDGGGWAALVTDTGVRWFRIPGPRFLQVSTKEEAEAAVAESAANVCPLFLEWRVDARDRGASEVVRDRWIERGQAAGITLVVGNAGTAITASEAAQRVRDVGRPDRAVAEFLAGYPIPAGVERSEVEARVHEHVRRVKR